MRSLVLAALALVALLPATASAQDWLIVSGLAYHLKGDHCNSITTGLGYERTHSETDRTQIGFYRNSNCSWSAYAAKAWLPGKFGSVRIGLIGGVVTGYESAITPAGGLAVTYEGKRYGLNLVGIPPAGSSSPGVLWLQAKVKW